MNVSSYMITSFRVKIPAACLRMEKGSFLPLNMEKKHSVSEDTGGHFPWESRIRSSLCPRLHGGLVVCACMLASCLSGGAVEIEANTRPA